MPVSRLRLGIAARFALAFLVGLAVLDLSLYGYLRTQSDRRLTRDLRALGQSLAQAVELELTEAPDSGVGRAARETLREWAAPPGAYLVLDTAGRALAERGDPGWLALARATPFTSAVWNGGIPPDTPVRRIVVPAGQGSRYLVAVLASSEQSEEEIEALAWWLAASLPPVLLLGLAGGYLLSRRALHPILELERAIAGITPEGLQQRLEVQSPPDEVDGVRQQFNTLLERLERARQGNQRFLRQAAHQIRTPLTLVMGEASLALRDGAGPLQSVLGRILRASEQMQRRVADLFVLAEAQAGSPIPRDEVVDVEGLVLEVADAARARAQQLEHPLRFRQVEPLVIRGNRALLREALLELLENGLRHSHPRAVVELAVLPEKGAVSVISRGPPFELTPPGDHLALEGRDRGLGLAIVQWIAGVHGGRVEVLSEEGINRVTLFVCADAAAPHGPILS